VTQLRWLYAVLRTEPTSSRSLSRNSTIDI